jgi:membrane-bound metal-dependent hydrolase YbcI (DUF457 family)
MFTGHFAAAIAAKAVAPRAPLWVYIGASQFVDIIWSGLIIAGIEKVGFDETLKGSPLDLYYMPYTHSLPAALGWSLLAALVARRWWPGGTAAMVGLVTFSHWLTDFLVHRPDLPLGFTAPKLGLGLWNYPAAEMALEIGLLGLATGMWVAQRVRGRQAAWPALVFLGFLVALQIFASTGAGATTAAALGQSALLAYGAVILVAALVDRRQSKRLRPL